MHNNMNVNVSGPVQPTSTYKTKVLKGNHSFASQVTESNMKYVIKHDFDLGGASVTIPEGCLLEFDGGSISNGILIGNVLNDNLNVSDFTKTEYIDEALRNIHNICNIAYIPTGSFKLNNVYVIPSSKQIVGNGDFSKVHLNENSYFKILEKGNNESWNIVLDNFSIIHKVGSENPAIYIDGLRYCRVSNLNIQSETPFNDNNTQTGILFKQNNDDSSVYYGATLSEFSNIRISHVKYGIILNANSTPTRDYITSCTFENINISAILDTGIKIEGRRIFANKFLNTIIQDSYAYQNIIKGIDFNGGYSNYFHNLTTWADAKSHEGHNFYALHFSGDVSLVSSPSYIDGSIEGLIGNPTVSVAANRAFLSRYKYNINWTNIDSPTRELFYSGRLSNISLGFGVKLYKVIDINDIVENPNLYNGVGSINLTNKYIEITNTENSNIGIEFRLKRTTLLAGSKIKAFARMESTSGVRPKVRVTINGNTYEYKALEIGNTLQYTDTIAEITEDVTSLIVTLIAEETTSLKIYNFCLLTYTDSSNYELPWEVFVNAEELFDEITNSPFYNKNKEYALANINDRGSNGDIYSVTDKRRILHRQGNYLLATDGHTFDEIQGPTSGRPKGVNALDGKLSASFDIGYQYYDTDLNKPIFAKEINNLGTVRWNETDGAKAGVARSGASRPVGGSIYVGFQFFDTTLGKPIYAFAISDDIVTWVDATGATV